MKARASPPVRKLILFRKLRAPGQTPKLARSVPAKQATMPRLLTKVTLQTLDWLIARTGRAEEKPEHRQTGRRGEEAAYFQLRQLGHVMVAGNFRSTRRRGEIDLVGWEGDILCFHRSQNAHHPRREASPRSRRSRETTRTHCHGPRIPAPSPHETPVASRRDQRVLRGTCASGANGIVQKRFPSVVKWRVCVKSVAGPC
jgi:hypothetical protein